MILLLQIICFIKYQNTKPASPTKYELPQTWNHNKFYLVEFEHFPAKENDTDDYDSTIGGKDYKYMFKDLHWLEKKKEPNHQNKKKKHGHNFNMRRI